jgi:hypothetical protein
MSTLFLNKSKLAAVLMSTKRTLTNYVNEGLLPQPERFGRDAGWSLDVLTALLNSEQAPQIKLTEQKRSRLFHAISDLTAPSQSTGCDLAIEGDAVMKGDTRQLLPEPIFMEPSFNPDSDLRSSRIAEVKNYRGLVEVVAKEAKQASKGTDEKSKGWSEVRDLHEQIAFLESRLAVEFVHMHSPHQLVGSRELFSSPLFNIRNHNSPRKLRVEIPITRSDKSVVKYGGPELRQDDGLVFMALLNIARDVRLGKSVSFSAQSVCLSLWGYYDGSCRVRLKGIISRLQEAVLTFPSFRVQLIQRFDFPKRGLWSVSLDSDIVQLLTKETVVWLDLQQRLALTNGLTSWLYGYVRSQTTLIPTKVDRLRLQSGSEGALDGFRDNLRIAMGVLAGAQVVDTGWYIDRYDMLHWLKPKAK